jgi:hypothetical protein
MANEPILVSRDVARRLLGDIGNTKLWELQKSGEIEGVLLGGKRLFVYQSIKDFADRLRQQRG